MTTITVTNEQRSIRARRALALGAGPAAALIGYLLLTLAGQDLRVPASSGSGSQELSPVLVLVVSMLASAAGWGLLRILEKVAPRRAKTAWTAVAFGFLLLSMSGPLSASPITGSQKVSLIALHLAVGLTVIPLLRRTAR